MTEGSERALVEGEKVRRLTSEVSYLSILYADQSSPLFSDLDCQSVGLSTMSDQNKTNSSRQQKRVKAENS